MTKTLGLAGFLVLCFSVAGVGGWFTSRGMPEWYMSLDKPGWNPPSWVFGPVWTTLYAAMAVSAWMVWKDAGWGGATPALSLFLIQLALNMAWSGIFFAFQSPEWALLEIAVLWLAILATTVLFFRHSPWAGGLLVPYLVWVAFAAVLNGAIVRLN